MFSSPDALLSPTPAELRDRSPRWSQPDGNDRLPSDIVQVPIVMVNVYFVGTAETGWVLIDAGLPFGAKRILNAARERFGDVPPKAILLTHGHFDHVGALRTLAETWDVPIYAHPMEMPYLTGQSSYPPPDPTVGGGLMARLSPAYPKGPYDFGDRLRELPADETVPFLPEWRWIPTPGHSPGHVSFFRERDRALIAGDAFVTQKQESLVGVVTRAKVLKGPPMYFTPDWRAACESVKRLADLRPKIAMTGHGLPIFDPPLADDLAALAAHFDERAVPDHGRYVDEPATTDSRGVRHLPPKPFDRTGMLMLGFLTVFAVGAVGYAICRSTDSREST